MKELNNLTLDLLISYIESNSEEFFLKEGRDKKEQQHIVRTKGHRAPALEPSPGSSR